MDLSCLASDGKFRKKKPVPPEKSVNARPGMLAMLKTVCTQAFRAIQPCAVPPVNPQIMDITSHNLRHFLDNS